MLVEGIEHHSDELGRIIRGVTGLWPPRDLERQQDRPAQFVEAPVVVDLGHDLGGQERDGLPPERSSLRPCGMGAHRECTKLLERPMGEDTQPYPVRDNPISGIQIFAIATGKKRFGLFDEFLLGLARAHFTHPDAIDP